MEIRFASIPKSASKTLKVQGLSGGTNERPHMPIRECPEWEKYDWHVVRRDTASWLESWWYEAKKARAPFTEALGMKFESIADDMAIFDSPPVIPPMKCEHLHSWIPVNFSEAFKPFHGRFQDFCYATIMDNVPCKVVNIVNLDAWLVEHGFKPLHINQTVK